MWCIFCVYSICVRCVRDVISLGVLTVGGCVCSMVAHVCLIMGVAWVCGSVEKRGVYAKGAS